MTMLSETANHQIPQRVKTMVDNPRNKPTTAPDPNDSTKTVPAPYNAANSGGSNLGPSNKALIDRVQGDIDALKKENPNAPVPQDLVTTSASGLDPHISP